MINTIQYSASKILWKSEIAKLSDFEPREEYVWKGGSPVGEHAEGKFEFNNGLINIIRSNLQGRYVVKVFRYVSVDHDQGFINKIIKGVARRILKIAFEAKVMSGSHNLWFIAKNPYTYTCIHNENIKIEIANTSWQKFDRDLRIPAAKDFILDLEDREVQITPGSIQIRNLIISETIC